MEQEILKTIEYCLHRAYMLETGNAGKDDLIKIAKELVRSLIIKP